MKFIVALTTFKKMKRRFGFFKTTMPDSRKADFHLGCLEGSVFLDFNVTSEKRIYLIRISFDGYGCCTIENIKHLSQQSSADFIEEFAKENLDQERISKIILEVIKMNSDNIWQEALEEYKLSILSY
ncbi:MAG: hypothetical protein JNK18_14235 [Cyclobacteriaceae bacterium]|nr:hypothetical protein [Cyclobacteriaceae bacterium]